MLIDVAAERISIMLWADLLVSKMSMVGGQSMPMLLRNSIALCFPFLPLIFLFNANHIHL